MLLINPVSPGSIYIRQIKVTTNYDSTKFIVRGQDPSGNVLVCPDILDGKPAESRVCSKSIGCKNVEDYYFNLRVKMKAGNYMGMWPSNKPIRIKEEWRLVEVEEQELELMHSENKQAPETELIEEEEIVAYSNDTPNGWMADSNQVESSLTSETLSEYTGLGIEEEQYAITGKRLENSDSSSSLAQLEDLPAGKTDIEATTELRINEDMIPNREDYSTMDNVYSDIHDADFYTDNYKNELPPTSHELINGYDDSGDLIDSRSSPNSPIQTSQSDYNMNRFQYDKAKLNPNPFETTQSEYNIKKLPVSHLDTSPSESDLDQVFNTESELGSETGSSSSGSSTSFNLNSLSDAFNRIAKTSSLPDLSKPPADDQSENDPYLKSQSQPTLSSFSRPTDDTPSNPNHSPSSSNSRRLAPMSGGNADDEDEEDYEDGEDAGDPRAELEEFLADGENDEDE